MDFCADLHEQLSSVVVHFFCIHNFPFFFPIFRHTFFCRFWFDTRRDQTFPDLYLLSSISRTNLHYLLYASADQSTPQLIRDDVLLPMAIPARLKTERTTVNTLWILSTIKRKNSLITLICGIIHDSCLGFLLTDHRLPRTASACTILLQSSYAGLPTSGPHNFICASAKCPLVPITAPHCIRDDWRQGCVGRQPNTATPWP